MDVRPLGSGHLDALTALASRPEVVRYGDHLATDPPDAWSEWLGEADGNRRLTLGAFERGELRAAAKLTLSARRRRLHCAELALIAPFDGARRAASALVGALAGVADRWLQVRRITHRAPAGHAYVEQVFAPAGFEVEGTRREAVERDGALADEVALARVDPELAVANDGPSFELPARGAPVQATFRPIRVEDAEAVARVWSDPRVAWGTLQIPFQRPELWRARLEHDDPERMFQLVAEVEGALVGSGGIFLEATPRRAHCASLGMGIEPAFQGRTVGRQLLDALVALSDERGVRRLELGVWKDNERARRIYEGAGFEVELEERALGYRDGSYVDDLAMARLR